MAFYHSQPKIGGGRVLMAAIRDMLVVVYSRNDGFLEAALFKGKNVSIVLRIFIQTWIFKGNDAPSLSY